MSPSVGVVVLLDSGTIHCCGAILNCHCDREEVPPIMVWEAEAALRKMARQKKQYCIGFFDDLLKQTYWLCGCKTTLDWMRGCKTTLDWCVVARQLLTGCVVVWITLE